MSSLVKLINTSDVDFNDQFNGAKFTVRAHDAELVPEGAMKLWCGDPDARDRPRQPLRREELDRLKTRFAANSGLAGDQRPNWDAVKPPLEAYDMDGTRLSTVIEDEDGTAGGSGSPIYTNEELSQMVVELANTNARLQAQIREGNVIEVDPLQPADDQLPPADNPNRVTVSAAPLQ